MPDAFADVGDFEGEMMDAFSFLIDEAGDRRDIVCRLQKLNFDTADFKKRGCDLFTVNTFNLIMFTAQQAGEKFVSAVKVFDRDADVFQFFHNWVNFDIQRRNFFPYSKVLRELSES